MTFKRLKRTHPLQISALRLWCLWIFAACAALSAANPAAAHLTPNSQITLEITDASVIADIIVPKGEYAFATGNSTGDDAASLATAETYLRDNFSVSWANGPDWQIAFHTVEFVQIEGLPDLHAIAVLTPPPGVVASEFTISWQALVNELPNHFALFLIENYDSGAAPTVAGAITANSGPLNIGWTRPGLVGAFTSAAKLGAHHILQGYDHIIFLLALLLPAPMLARSGRWKGQRGVGATIGKLVKIVTAFTIGHSLTLVAATLGNWQMPAAPVEVAIAVSVLASAVHAWHPLMPDYEHVIAGLFGLVHGLAFATLVQHAGAEMASGVISLLGFNVGIELVQLAIVAAVAPSLLILSRSPVYGPLRQVLALLCGVAAALWIVDRTTSYAGSLVAGMEAALLDYSALLIAALAGIAAIVFAYQRCLPRAQVDPLNRSGKQSANPRSHHASTPKS